MLFNEKLNFMNFKDNDNKNCKGGIHTYVIYNV